MPSKRLALLVHLSVWMSVCPSVAISFFVCLPVWLSACLFPGWVCPYVCPLLVWILKCLPIYNYISTYLFFCLSIRLPVFDLHLHLSAVMSIYLFIYLSDDLAKPGCLLASTGVRVFVIQVYDLHSEHMDSWTKVWTGRVPAVALHYEYRQLRVRFACYFENPEI